ncbi:MAG TPA: 30S ribosomal protein S20 [Polyangiaceae bacterium]|jgi:small subunit ribosomal protein S20|nr:30S ribosomal protein S20 [Polyangiaceae bacterium]
MANHPSAAKRNRQRIKRTARNKTLRSALRTAVKKARAAVAAGDADVKTKIAEAVVSLARAASAGVIHRNAASRTTSRITSALSKRSSAS